VCNDELEAWSFGIGPHFELKARFFSFKEPDHPGCYRSARLTGLERAGRLRIRETRCSEANSARRRNLRFSAFFVQIGHGTALGVRAPEPMSVACASQPRVLIADDQSDLLDALRLLLKGEGIQMEAVTSPEAAVRAIENGRFDLLLMDLNYTGDTTSGREGIDLLARVQAVDSMLPVIVMTGWGSVDLAVEAMRRGVRDFVQKPWDNAQLVTTLRSEIDAGRARRAQLQLQEREMSEARRIQQKLLPATLPQIAGCSIAASWQPAAGVGGDCYDALAFGESRVAISIADVVGKGIPAALLMSNLQAAVRAFASDGVTPADLCHQVNRILCGNIAEGRFISFFYSVVDTTARTLAYANAGHYPAVVVRANGAVERLTQGGPVFGVFPDATYDQGVIAFGSGDRVILYTDGITEARNADDEEFGEDRLIAAAVEYRSADVPTLERRLSDAVNTFTAGSYQDDATLIVIGAN